MVVQETQDVVVCEQQRVSYSNKTALDIGLSNIHYMQRNPEIRPFNANQLPDLLEPRR
jgi:hypothetical protein